MNKYYYPAVFQPEDVGYSIWLYDVDGCISQGDSLQEAIENIREAFGLYCEEYKSQSTEFPEATNPAKIPLDEGQFVALIEFDWLEYQKKYNSKAVKKTLSIPAWLNTIAEENNVNFSGILQDALTERLNLNN